LLILMLYAFIPVQTSFIFQSVLHKENIWTATTKSM
jgi:hypothetical protein